MHNADDIAERVSSARRITVLTGAGISAESGIPTFRGGDDSLWNRFDPSALATAQAFRQQRDLVWGWYVWRMAKVRHAQPNEGHRVLAWLQDIRPEVHIVTQNVDDLHERAGSRRVTHLHGSLFALRCFECAEPYDGFEIPAEAIAAPLQQREPPRCAHCGGDIRPGVVWFNEALPEHTWQAAVDAVGSADLVISIGTSGVVQPAASLAQLAQVHGAYLVDINPQAPANEALFDCRWRTTAVDALVRLRDALQ